MLKYGLIFKDKGMLSRILQVARIASSFALRSKSAIGISTAPLRAFMTRKTNVAFGFVPLRNFSAYPTHKVLAMPNLSPTMTKGTITKWYKKEGDSFIAGDVLCDVETDKATVGFEMVDVGVLAKIICPTGSKDVPLGAPVCVVVDSASDVPAFADFKAGAPAPKAAAGKAPEKKEEPKEIPKEKAASGDKVSISPVAKRLAADNKVDLGMVKGTGPHGRILKEDVQAYIENAKKGEQAKPAEAKPAEPKPAAKPAAAPKPVATIPGLPEFIDLELSNYKRVAAERLTEAKQTIPHFYVSIECECDNLLKLREELNKTSKSKISINDLLIKAASLACRKVPDANAAWMGTFIRRYKDVDMCVAVQTPNGLIAPIVPRSNLKGVEQIALDTKALIDKAKVGKLKPEEFIGGTFTISNAGMFGISQLISIVNPPQACILGVSQVEKKFVVDETKINTDKPWRIVSKLMGTLSCDHRVVDGAVASEWTKEFKKLVENPHLMLL
jgi:pyruvate dehydrogenase E2 component (dihydrolipoamide acetyltransferase)